MIRVSGTNNRPKRKHSPISCGLDYETDCDDCRAAAEDEVCRNERKARRRIERQRTAPDAKRIARAMQAHPRLFRQALAKLLGKDLIELINARIRSASKRSSR